MNDWNDDRWLFSDTLRECLCENASGTLLQAVVVDDLEVSLWIFQADDGGEGGYAVKLKRRGASVYPGEPLSERDIENLAKGFCWAMSQFAERSDYLSWRFPPF